MHRIKVGILFGGPSKEREISFAGGRTVYDNLDKSIFEPVPIFVDSFKNLILLDWQYVYKGSIRDFYPPVDFIPERGKEFQIYIESIDGLNNNDFDRIASEIGKRIDYNELKDNIDVAFLALHGEFGEDGQIQAIFDSMEIPYTGSGVLPSSMGMDKGIQKTWMDLAGFPVPKSFVLQRQQWVNGNDTHSLINKIHNEVGNHFVIRPANQGSSIGVSILEDCTEKELEEAVNAAFFIKEISKSEWDKLSEPDKILRISDLADIRSGIGMPVKIANELVSHPIDLLDKINQQLSTNERVIIESVSSDQKALIEGFIDGREFSCIVLRDEQGKSLALPPTEIVKSSEVYDYRSKYLPGLSRKLTPIDLPIPEIEKIQKECEKLFELFGFHTYARIDGFYTEDGVIYLNDPNTTSGMLPSSFFFHQAAELGLNPSQLISFIIRQSVKERMDSSPKIGLHKDLLIQMDKSFEENKDSSKSKKRVGVILGGYSTERHISVESGRNIFEKLASSGAYDAIPIFLSKSEEGFAFHQLPINLLLKDNADDISEKIANYKKHPFIEILREKGKSLIDKYASLSAVLDPQLIKPKSLADHVDAVFIALHGRPGEDGELQGFLDRENIPYNGSGPQSSSVTINKYQTLQKLKAEGFIVADQFLLSKINYKAEQLGSLEKIERNFKYPFVAKPVDDGCSSAVVLIKSRAELINYLDAIFREGSLSDSLRSALELMINEEFPRKEEVLIEERITAKGANHFLEITGGLLTRYSEGELKFEVFEPSEALAGDEILTLEEKFLAGEGQNITPARFANDQEGYNRIAKVVKSDFERAARILHVEGYARIDAFVRVYEDRVETVIIEINSLPGMTPATCIFHQSAINGYKPFDFIDNILDFAFEKKKIDALKL